MIEETVKEMTTTKTALSTAAAVQKRAASTGFNWEEPSNIIQKIIEEVEECIDALTDDEPHAKIAEEVGDLLFTVTNLATFLEVDADAALTAATDKFTKRFTALETHAKSEDLSLADLSFEELLVLWENAKEASSKES